MASFGERMRREREMRGIKLEEISESTKISRRNLLALEEEQFDRLPGGIFNKGFVRAYSRYLGLDEEQAVQDFMSASANYDQPVALQPPAPETSLVRPPVIPSDASERRKDLAWALAALLVLGAGSGGWYYLNHTGGRPATQPSAGAHSSDGAPAKSDQRLVSPGASSHGATGGNPSAELNPVASVASQAANEPLVLAIRANKEAWVSMVVDGKPYMDNVLVPGNERMVRARERIVLRTGNAGGLEISYNGKSLAPIGREGQVRTVTFTSEGPQQ